MDGPLEFYEQEYGNCAVAPETDVLANMALSKRLIEEKWPNGVWTTEPHLVEVPALRGSHWQPRGWYGVFAPLGVVQIPDVVNVDA